LKAAGADWGLPICAMLRQACFGCTGLRAESVLGPDAPGRAPGAGVRIWRFGFFSCNLE